MIIDPINPDIRSILAQIEEGEIDLDPEFQRGDVWNREKQQLLIDTILRDWKIPPIFLIKIEDGWGKEVLDGHQRLQAIRLFCKDKYSINGHLEPSDEAIKSLHGLKFSEMPEEIKRKFRSFSLNTFQISHYEENEPFELFYRLNMNAVLTSAERRNTFFGPAREDTKRLVKVMEDTGFNSQTIGFNNTRLGYNDIIARVLFASELGDITRKISDRDITKRYRQSGGFDDKITREIESSLTLLIECLNEVGKVKFNKASLFSILLFMIYAVDKSVSKNEFCSFLCCYRAFLESYKRYDKSNSEIENILSNEYGNRISVSVYDAKSVIFRHYFFCWLAEKNQLSILNSNYRNKFYSIKYQDLIQYENFSVAETLIANDWGNLGEL